MPQLFGEVSEKERADPEPHLKREASKAEKGLGGLFSGVGPSVFTDVSKGKVSEGREKLKV